LIQAIREPQFAYSSTDKYKCTSDMCAATGCDADSNE